VFEYGVIQHSNATKSDGSNVHSNLVRIITSVSWLVGVDDTQLIAQRLVSPWSL